jgi:hypothetical protein
MLAAQLAEHLLLGHCSPMEAANQRLREDAQLRLLQESGINISGASTGYLACEMGSRQ